MWDDILTKTVINCMAFTPVGASRVAAKNRGLERRCRIVTFSTRELRSNERLKMTLFVKNVNIIHKRHVNSCNQHAHFSL